MKKKLLLLVMTFLLSSCLKEENFCIEQDDTWKRITFAVSEIPMQEEPVTRGIQVTDLSSFGMIGTRYPATEIYNDQSLGNYFYNIEVEPLVSTIYLWPTEDCRMAFHGYYPYNNENISVSPEGTSGPPAYTYTVPENISSQVDFMTTEVLDHTCGTQTPLVLTFHHRLSDIRFTAVNERSTSIIVKSVSLLGVKYSGILSGDIWTLTGDANSAFAHPFTLNCNYSIPFSCSIDLTGVTNHFLMIPQTVAAGTELIRIVTEEKGEENTYSYVLPEAVTLAAGKVYNYVLSFNNDTTVDTGSDIEDNPEDGEDIYTNNYLTFIAIEDGTFSFSQDGLSYSLDGGVTWTTLAAKTNTPTLMAGESIIWKNTASMTYPLGRFSSSQSFDIEGNIMSLLYGDDFRNQTNIEGKDSTFYTLFADTKVRNAVNLRLPATTLNYECYALMFGKCSSLISAPPLPATVMSDLCYAGMFAGCTSLITAPSLPATSLAEECYAGMFAGCSSLTTAPTLPANILTTGCYESMFDGCTSLTTAPTLPATTLANYCYYNMFFGCTALSSIAMLATDVSADACLGNWVGGVTTAGTFVKAPEMTTLPSGNNGVPDGWAVQNYGE